jgi:hypothetical protein
MMCITEKAHITVAASCLNQSQMFLDKLISIISLQILGW